MYGRQTWHVTLQEENRQFWQRIQDRVGIESTAFSAMNHRQTWRPDNGYFSSETMTIFGSESMTIPGNSTYLFLGKMADVDDPIALQTKKYSWAHWTNFALTWYVCARTSSVVRSKLCLWPIDLANRILGWRGLCSLIVACGVPIFHFWNTDHDELSFISNGHKHNCVFRLWSFWSVCSSSKFLLLRTEMDQLPLRSFGNYNILLESRKENLVNHLKSIKKFSHELRLQKMGIRVTLNSRFCTTTYSFFSRW